MAPDETPGTDSAAEAPGTDATKAPDMADPAGMADMPEDDTPEDDTHITDDAPGEPPDYTMPPTHTNDGERDGAGTVQYPLIAGIIIAVGVAAFFAGAFITGSGQVSEEYIDDAMARLELKLLQQRLPAGDSSAQAPPPVPSIDDDPIIGDPDAPIEIIEFSDFQCPFCARFYIQTLPLLMEEYIDTGRAKLVFRDFPLQNIHPNAAAAALAAECADDQKMFKGMHDILFDRQREWAAQATGAALGLFSQYADEIGADQAAFDGCIADQTHIDEISRDLNDGVRYGVEGTPGFFIGNEEIGHVQLRGAQPYEAFKQVLDQIGA